MENLIKKSQQIFTQQVSKATAFEEKYTKTKQYNEFDASEIAEALEMNARLDAAFARIDELAPDEDAKAIFKAIASKYEVGCVMGVSAAHAEALEMSLIMEGGK